MDHQAPQTCGSCKHFEASGEWRRGWCRNTLLFAPGQSHAVRSDECDCRDGAHSFWEPKPEDLDAPKENAGMKPVKLPTFENPLKLFSPALPAFASAGPTGGSMMFSSGSGSGGGGFDDDNYGYDDDFGFEGEMPPAEDPKERPRPRSNRSRRAGAGGNRARTSSYQPEERYWTDYLRIALPVIGIILMVGLLWVWASHLLSNDVPEGSPKPDDSIAAVQTETVDPEEVNTEPGSGVDANVSTPDANTTTGEIPISGTNAQPTAPPTVEPTEPVKTGGDSQTTDATGPAETTTEFTDGMAVRVTENDVNIRPAAGTSEDPIRTSKQGETGVILSGPEEADGHTWWQVVFDTPGDTGWIVEQYLEPVD